MIFDALLTWTHPSKSGNALSIDEDGGLFVGVSGDGSYQIPNATAGDLVGLDANGKFTDSGIAGTNLLTTANLATDAEVEEALNNVFNP